MKEKEKKKKSDSYFRKSHGMSWVWTGVRAGDGAMEMSRVAPVRSQGCGRQGVRGLLSAEGREGRGLGGKKPSCCAAQGRSWRTL